MTQATVKIKQGVCRDATGKVQNVAGKVFPLIKQYTPGKKGGFVTVDGTALFGKPKLRVKVPGVAAYEFVTGTLEAAVAESASVNSLTSTTETDEETMARIEERFSILDDMTKASIAGDIRAMIVVGPPGVGKSFGVERQLEKANLFDDIAGKRAKYEVVKGASTALGLYCTLFKNSDPGMVLVFDDCDTVLVDDVSLNLLKGALDSGKRRRISWNADSSMLRKEGIPDQFDFKGSVIFITNLNFDTVRSQKLRDQLEALQSRCHYLDLTLNTMRDKFLRIKQIARKGDLFENYGFSNSMEQEILDFMAANKDSLREMSLRMAIKIADLVKSFPDKWKEMARVTVMKAA